MTALGSDFDRGNVLPNATGTKITNAYNIDCTSDGSVGGTAVTTAVQVTPFSSAQTMLTVLAALNGASTITALAVKMEISYDRTNWLSVQSRNTATNGAPTYLKEHTGLAVTAGSTVGYVFTCDPRGANFLRVSVHADQTGNANDVITANLTLA